MIDDPDYARIFTKMRVACWQCGYALTVHGSATRDLDILAVPWTEKAWDIEKLVNKLLYVCPDLQGDESPSERPHGRTSYNFTFKEFGDPRWVDLSIFPPLDNNEQEIIDES